MACARLTSSMKILLAISLLAMLLGSCATQDRGPLPSVAAVKSSIISEGTLANASVAREASSTVRTLAGGSARISQYLIKNPSGREGSRTWSELWVYDPRGRKKNFMMIFTEDGSGTANFEIEEM